MRGRPDGWVQGYNVGAVVDETAQVIVDTAVTADPTDTRSLPGLVEQVRANSGRSPRRLLADAGYGSDDNLAAIADAGIDAYVALTRDHHGREAPAAPGAGSRPDSRPGDGCLRAADQSGPRPLRAAQGDRGEPSSARSRRPARSAAPASGGSRRCRPSGCSSSRSTTWASCSGAAGPAGCSRAGP